MKYRITEVIEFIIVFMVISGILALVLTLFGIDFRSALHYADWIITGILLLLAAVMFYPRKKSR